MFSGFGSWRVGVLGAWVLAALVLSVPLSGQPPAKAIELTSVGVYRTHLFDGGGAEIAAYDAATKRLFVVNLDDEITPRIDVVDISNPANPFLALTIPMLPYGSQANSVAVHDGVVAVAVQASPKTNPGKVVFFDAYGAELAQVGVGALPDMLTFSPNGRFVLVANEGEPNDAYTIDPEGSVSIIDLSHGVHGLTSADVTTAGFAAFNNGAIDPRIRIYGTNATVAKDLEPEYIAVSPDSRTAWVTLQENNAFGIIDLTEKRVTELVALGFKNHLLAENALDPTDTGGVISIGTWPVWGMYQPDAIAAFQHLGQTYLVTANEGDVREYAGLLGGNETRRVSTLSLDATAFPNAAFLKQNANMGRLNVTIANGDTDGDGDFDRLFANGARSFSIWDAAGQLVFDSGDDLERLTAANAAVNFNASNTSANIDTRSDDKGPEPEGVTVARLFGRLYMFLALERVGGVVVYELGNPAQPAFVQYINVRKFNEPQNTDAAEDLGPEGLFVISEEESPTGIPLLVVANEVSGTTRIFSIRPSK